MADIDLQVLPVGNYVLYISARRVFAASTTMKKFTIAVPLAALTLPVLLATSAFAKDKMMEKKPAMSHKMSGGAMSGGKMMGGHKMGGSMMSVKGLVPMSGKMPSKSQMMGAKVVSTMMMHGRPCYTVRLKSGKTMQMCKPADQKMMGGKMSGGKMMGAHKMSGKM
ncbi:MAG: hypothetical protein EOO68_08745 [Moraxellaceae bacterium]|nr:MAG: hypothetical protein EOO68_08745 [Moraxellaceae bacterium]